MERRGFLKIAVTAGFLWSTDRAAALQLLSSDTESILSKWKSTTSPPSFVVPKQQVLEDDKIKDYLYRVRNPNLIHKGDIFLEPKDKQILNIVIDRMKRLYRTIGYGNFGVLGFNDALNLAKAYSSVGAFSDSECKFLEMIFFRDAREYGFFGKKQIVSLGQKIKGKEIHKIPYTGCHLFRGKSLDTYLKIKKDLGEEVLLTSGIRGLTKQFYLFLRKAGQNDGNLSLASRSLAPPGYSYHATGDFDIGQMGLGADNFSERFTNTPVFKKLIKSGYVINRYERDNRLGVRYEPWHIKLVI